VAIKTKKKTIKVENTDLMVTMKIIKNGDQNKALTCGWWDKQSEKLVTDDIEVIKRDDIQADVLACKTSHLTEFLGVLTEKVVARFKEGNWSYFGVPT